MTGAPAGRPAGFGPGGLSRAVWTPLLTLALAGCARQAQAPDILLVTIDTLRADRLGTYGGPAVNSPTLDGLARQSTVFENALSQAPHTIPSLLQIMASRYAEGDQIPAQERTLAERLAARGYATAAVVENCNIEFDLQAHGLSRGFASFSRNGVIDRGDVVQQLYKTNTPADAVTARARHWLRQRPKDRPFFLWLHYSDPHDPYLPPFADDLEALSQRSSSRYTGDIRATTLYTRADGLPHPEASDADRRHLVDLYDAEVRYVDQSFGDLLEQMRNQGLFEPALVVVSADHGESLGEHEVWTHGRSVYQPELHIPLMVKLPHQRHGARRTEAVEAIDIAPTILAASGLPPEGQGFDGANLFSRPARPAFAFWSGWEVVRQGAWKLIRYGETVLLFDLSADPGETRNLASERPEIVAQLEARRVARLGEVGSSGARLQEQSHETLERLRSLGYIGR